MQLLVFGGDTAICALPGARARIVGRGGRCAREREQKAVEGLPRRTGSVLPTDSLERIGA